MKNFFKSILSLALVAAVLGGIWMYISKMISADDLEDEFDDDFDNIDEFDDDELEDNKKKRGYFTLKTKVDNKDTEVEAEA